jgi:hypothetical protein
VNILPRYAASQRLQYGKHIKAMDLFRLLLFEMLRGGRKTEKQHFRKESASRGSLTRFQLLEMVKIITFNLKPGKYSNF